MSLGYTKDSFLNLAELAKEKEASLLKGNKSFPKKEQRDDASAEGTESDVQVVETTASDADDSEGHSVSDASSCHQQQHYEDRSVFVENGGLHHGVPSVAAEPPNYPPSRGFDYDYSDYEYDFFADDLTRQGGERDSLWCCLFPQWFQPKSIKDDDDPDDETLGNNDDGREEEQMVKVGKGDDVIPQLQSRSEDDEQSSVGSEVLGEKLSDKDQKAVLARLRLAQPDSAATLGSSSSSGQPSAAAGSKSDAATNGVGQNGSKGLLNNVASASGGDSSATAETAASPVKRGILKQGSLKHGTLQASSSSSAAAPATVSPARSQGGDYGKISAQAKKRRSLFPVYEKQATKKEHNVNFAGMARVITVRSTNDMTEKEKGEIWWQKSDYDDFRRTARMITKAILQPGSEIWLSTEAASPAGRGGKNGSRFQIRTQAASSSLADEAETTASDKWWHKFGHSRRGLEHIASMEEGRERQSNCQHAVRAVVQEQRKQLAQKGRVDAEKLRSVGIQHTSWARDLALAAGSSDADAVRQQFESKRKSREFYLLKMTAKNPNPKKYENVPSFMQPVYATKSPRLDAHKRTKSSSSSNTNTTKKSPTNGAQLSNKRAELLERKKAAAAAAALQQQQQQRANGGSASASSSPPVEPPSSPRDSTLEPIHDKDDTKESMSKRAAGFSHVGAEKVSMSTVLSGMGAVATTKAAAVGA